MFSSENNIGKSISNSSNLEYHGWEGQYGHIIKPFITLSVLNLSKTLSIRGRGGNRYTFFIHLNEKAFTKDE